MNDNNNNIQFDNGEETIDVASEIGITYSYDKHKMRGYHCTYTTGMDKYGAPELCLMDYYPPEEAQYILLNMADLVLNGILFDPETEEYNFFNIVELVDENGQVCYRFGFIGGWLYDIDTMCLQRVDEEGSPIHIGSENLPSWYKRGFEPWPLYMYMNEEDDEESE